MPEKAVMQEYYFTSSFRGKMRRMAGRLWQPAPLRQITEDGEFYDIPAKPRALVQILHGMQEHCGRYDEVARCLAEAGFLVLAYDQAGHGGSLGPEDTPGYFDDYKGWDRLVEDAVELKRGVAPSYPDCPVFLLGHSMGSLVARTIAARYGGDYDGFIFCGTVGKIPLLPLGRLIARFLCSTGGRRKPSPFLNQLIFGAARKRFRSEASPFAWLSRDRAVVEAFEKDPLCGIPFTAGGFQDLFEGLNFLQSKEWAGLLPKRPILFIAGAEDPVGDYGRGVEEVAKRLREAGQDQVVCRIYPEMRHEIFNEIGRQEVYQDLLAWLEEQLEPAGTPEAAAKEAETKRTEAVSEEQRESDAEKEEEVSSAIGAADQGIRPAVEEEPVSPPESLVTDRSSALAKAAAEDLAKSPAVFSQEPLASASQTDEGQAPPPGEASGKKPAGARKRSRQAAKAKKSSQEREEKQGEPAKDGER